MQFFNVKKPIAFFYVTRLLKLFLFDKTVIGFAGYIWKLNVMFMRLGIETSHQKLFKRFIISISDLYAIL